MNKLIVSRHEAAVAFIRNAIKDEVDINRVVPIERDAAGNEYIPNVICVRDSVTENDVRGADVIGNLPLHLAALCARYRAVEFSGPAPRGAEYTLDDMIAAGAHLVEYYVKAMKERAPGVPGYHCETCANAMGDQCGPIR